MTEVPVVTPEALATAAAAKAAVLARAAQVIPTIPVNHGEKPEKNSTAQMSKGGSRRCCSTLTTLGFARLLWEDPTRGLGPISAVPPLTRGFAVSWEATLIKSRARVGGNLP
ncbi:hypothetical protein Acr_20g0002730 [Actinidia rufa]|uniref:Uncharacterized protein n=1 Tax=Actinidia rufa TaxID=165716 RepID=A0A7J0GCC6_9ERIC|nr:hypothetical protein Acr_20g0002730 [Actinidia rufa]